MNTTQKTVGELAVEFPNATRVFERVGIDYCCGGHRSLRDACMKAGVAVSDITGSLEQSATAGSEEQTLNFSAIPLTELINYVIERHHSFTKTEVQRLGLLIDKVWEEHHSMHLELTQLRTQFHSLRSELEPHMLKEECVLFPYIRRMHQAIEDHHLISTPPFRTVTNPVHMMTIEHDAADYLLQQMRRITSNYTAPPDACPSHKSLYEALENLEQDLHQHIHLENNILFPRAQEMEIGLLI